MNRNPNLIHPEIAALYEHDFSIPEEIIEKILALPRPSLIKDLEAVLTKSIQNYKNYGIEPEGLAALAPAHAIFLLGELEAIETLPTVNQFFNQGFEFLNYRLGDLLTEEIWQAIYKLAQADITQLFSFITTPMKYVFAKAPHLRAALTFMTLNPNSRKEVTEAYKQLFQELIQQAKASPNFTDENAILSSVVFRTIHFGLIELADEIKLAVKSGLVDDYDATDWEAIYKELVKNKPDIQIGRIHQHYEAIKRVYVYG